MELRASPWACGVSEDRGLGSGPASQASSGEGRLPALSVSIPVPMDPRVPLRGLQGAPLSSAEQLQLVPIGVQCRVSVF